MILRMGVTRALRLLSGAATGTPTSALATVPDLTADLTPAGLPVPELSSPFIATPSTLSTIVWAELLGKTSMPATRTEAMGVPAIAKARHVVCPKLASTPLKTLRGEDELENAPWVYRTDDPISPWHRMLWTVDDLVFYGWSLWAARRGTDGSLQAAQRVGAGRWEFDKDGQLLVDKQGVRSSEVILIPGPHEGILNFGRTTIRHNRQLLEQAARAGQVGSAQVELHQTDPNVELTRDDITQLVQDWVDARLGDNGGVAYTSHSIQANELGSIDGALLIDGRNAGAVDCARIVGVAAAMVDATVPKSSLTYETTQGRGLEHTAYGLEPYADAIAARLSMDDVVPRGQRVRFDITQDITPQPPATGPTVED